MGTASEIRARTKTRYIPEWKLPRGVYQGLELGCHAYALLAIREFEDLQIRLLDRTELSPAGKAVELERGAQPLLAEINKRRESELARERGNLARSERELDRRMRLGTEEGADQSVALARQREIRDWFRGLDPDERVGVLMTAFEEDDRECIAAILDAPKAFGALVPAEAVRRVEGEMKARAFPSEFKRVEGLRDAVELASIALGTAEGEIRDEIRNQLASAGLVAPGRAATPGLEEATWAAERSAA